MTVVVAFVSRKGGVGKSTLARAIATLAIHRGLNTALADLDQDQQTSTRWHRLRTREGVSPALTVNSYGNVDSAVASLPDADLLVIDTPSHAPDLTMEVASVAHLVVQPAGASFDELQPAVELFHKLRASGVPRSRLYFALSRLLDPAEEQAARAYIEVTDFNVLPGALVERARYREAHNRGLALVECAGEDLSGSGGVALTALLTKVISKHRLLHDGAAAGPAAPATRLGHPVQGSLSAFRERTG